jgi:hypothetical protein
MHRLQTQLIHFRFNSIHMRNSFNVIWYKLDEVGRYGMCFSLEELNLLTNYITNTPLNFSNITPLVCDEGKTPTCTFIMPMRNRRQPDNLILKRQPQMPNRPGMLTKCMDVQLLTANGTLNHNYNLDFNIIGEIIR